MNSSFHCVLPDPGDHCPGGDGRSLCATPWPSRWTRRGNWSVCTARFNLFLPFSQSLSCNCGVKSEETAHKHKAPQHRRTFAFPVVCSFMIIAKSFHKWLIPIRPRESRPGDQQTTLPGRKHLRSFDGCRNYSNLKLRRLRLCEPFCQPPKEISAGRYWLSFFYFGQKQEVIELYERGEAAL